MSLRDIADEINGLLDEFKREARRKLFPSDYNMFKYRCLGHCESALSGDSEWMDDPRIDNLYMWADKIDDNNAPPGDDMDE